MFLAVFVGQGRKKRTGEGEEERTQSWVVGKWGRFERNWGRGNMIEIVYAKILTKKGVNT